MAEDSVARLFRSCTCEVAFLLLPLCNKLVDVGMLINQLGLLEREFLRLVGIDLSRHLIGCLCYSPSRGPYLTPTDQLSARRFVDMLADGLRKLA
jgi:hypothetical protein